MPNVNLREPPAEGAKLFELVAEKSPAAPAQLRLLEGSELAEQQQPKRRVLPAWRSNWLLSSFVLIVVLIPTLACLYLTFWASSRYVTEFRVAVRSAEPLQQAGLSALLGMGLGGQSSTDRDSSAIVQYLESLPALTDIGREVDLKEMYARSAIDLFSRVSTEAPAEAMLRHWKNMVQAYYEHSTSTVVVRVSAFSPDESLNLAEVALDRSERLINDMSARARHELVAFSEKEVEAAERRLSDASAHLTTVMDQTGTLDLKLSAQALTASLSRLRDEISTLNAVLTSQRGRLDDSSPAVTQTKARLAAAQEEYDKLRGSITGIDGSQSSLSSTVGSFARAESEREFAEKAYVSALASLESAKVDAIRRQAYLATIVQPQLAQEAAFPKPVFGTFMVAAVCLLIWVLGSVTVFAIKEHI